MHRAQRAVSALGAALLITTIAIVGAAAPILAAPDAGVAVVAIDGRGHGHGVGLSQWGAHTMASQGRSAAEILATFYPDTQIGTATGDVVVVVERAPTIRVSLPQGGQIRSAREGAQADGFPIDVGPGEVVAVSHDGGAYVVRRDGGVRGAADDRQRFGTTQQECVVLCDDPDEDPEEPEEPEEPEDPDECLVCTSTTTTTAPPSAGPEPTPPTTAPPTSPPSSEPAPAASATAHRSPTPIWAIPNGGTVTAVDRGLSYRGAMEVTGGPGALRARNHVHVEDYLRGMAEVPGHWPPAAVQAQAVAARTYVLRAMASAGEICDSESCQVYRGTAHESPGQDAAVAATHGWVVTHGGRLAATFYSASGGGHSANVAEGFGADYDIPYLQARPYETANPKPWAVDVALSDVGARLGYAGTVTNVRVTATGPSGRAVSMALDGDAGAMSVDPQDFRRRLGLQSTLFTVETAVADEAPPPPPPPVEQDQLSTDGSTRVGGAAPSSQLTGLLAADRDLEAAAPRVEDLAPRAAPSIDPARTLTAGAATLALAAVAAALGNHLLGGRAGAALATASARLWRWRPRVREGSSSED